MMYGQDEEEFKPKRTNWILAITCIGVIVIVALLIGRLGVVVVDKAVLIFLVLFLFVPVALKTSWYKFRYKTRKIVHPEGFSTFIGSFVKLEGTNNCIFNIGTIRSGGMKTEAIREGIAIASVDSIVPLGSCAILNVKKVREIELDEIPDKIVYAYIVENKIRPPYYYCESADEELHLNYVNPEILKDIIKEITRENNELKQMIKDKFNVTEDVVASMTNIKSKASGGYLKAILTKAPEILKRKEED